MASYAPLFAHVDAWQWTPNLIWFDNLKSFGTPNYYVQQVFGQNHGTTDSADHSERRCQGRARRDLLERLRSTSATHEVIVKLVNPGDDARTFTLTLDGCDGDQRGADRADGPTDVENSIAAPTTVAPRKVTAAPSRSGTPVFSAGTCAARVETAHQLGTCARRTRVS